MSRSSTDFYRLWITLPSRVTCLEDSHRGNPRQPINKTTVIRILTKEQRVSQKTKKIVATRKSLSKSSETRIGNTIHVVAMLTRFPQHKVGIFFCCNECQIPVLTLVGRAFKRVKLSLSPVVSGSTELASRTKADAPQPLNEVDNNVMPATCLACGKTHPTGYCPLKHAGVEHCPLCGLAHYGHYRTCPHLSSLTQCRRMLDALKQSTEPAAERKRAKQYLVGIIGDLNRRRRRDQQQAQGEAGDGPAQTLPTTYRGMPGQAPSMSLMHVNGGVQGLPSQQHPTDQVSSRSLVHDGGNKGHQGVVNQRFDAGNPAYSSPYGGQLTKSNGQFHGPPSSTNTGGGEPYLVNGSGHGAGNNGRHGGPMA